MALAYRKGRERENVRRNWNSLTRLLDRGNSEELRCQGYPTFAARPALIWGICVSHFSFWASDNMSR